MSRVSLAGAVAAIACMDTFSDGQSARMGEIVATYKPSLGQ